MIFSIILVFASTLFLVSVYVYATNSLNYWKKRNVKHDPPIPLFGNHLQNQLAKKSLAVIVTELYKKYPNEKVIGYYRGTTPELIIKDLDLIRNFLSVDFSYFHERGFGNLQKEPLFRNLFHGDGDVWRLLRQRLTPAFTSAKLKAMFPLVVRCAQKLQDIVRADEDCDARDLMARFSTEFIGACGFGVEMDTINNEGSQFRELGKLIFSYSHAPKNRLLIPLAELFPKLRTQFKVIDRRVDEAIAGIVQTVQSQRNYKPSGRNDFIDLLLELEAKGKITGDSIERTNKDGTPVSVEMKMDFECIVAQVFIFFGAGFETSSSATSFCLHELAFHPEVQSKVQQEIDQVMSKYDNKLCYDAIADMSYLEMTFKEAMRIFPSFGGLNRVCTRRYTIPGSDVVLDPGVKILIPVQAIHMDEKYYDNPKEFRPERFSAEEAMKRHKFAYLPFGEGPRNCIGSKLGLMQSLAGLAALLHKFNVEPAPNTKLEIEVDPTLNHIQGVKGSMPIRFRSRTGKSV